MNPTLQALNRETDTPVRVTRDTRINLKGNKGKWHIFLNDKETCLCGHTKRGDYSRNHCQKNTTVNKVLEHPGRGLIGNISKHGLNSLKKRVITQ